MRKTHLDLNAGNPGGKHWGEHMKSIGHAPTPKNKSVRRIAEKRYTGNVKKQALKNKMN